MYCSMCMYYLLCLGIGNIYKRVDYGTVHAKSRCISGDREKN